VSAVEEREWLGPNNNNNNKQEYAKWLIAVRESRPELLPEIPPDKLPKILPKLLMIDEKDREE
jgi:hypothetical protein